MESESTIFIKSTNHVTKFLKFSVSTALWCGFCGKISGFVIVAGGFFLASYIGRPAVKSST